MSPRSLGFSPRMWCDFQQYWPAWLRDAYLDFDCHGHGRFEFERNGSCIRFKTDSGSVNVLVPKEISLQLRDGAE